MFTLRPEDSETALIGGVARANDSYDVGENPYTTIVANSDADKKARAGKLRFVLTPRIGKAASHDRVPLAAVERVLRFAPHFFCGPGKGNA